MDRKCFSDKAFLQVPIWVKISIHSNNSTKFFFEIGPYIGYCIKNHIDSNPYYLTIPSSGLVEGYPGVGEVRRVVATSFYINMREISTGE